MPACPTCHIYEGLWSPLNQKDGMFVCQVNRLHKFTQDKDGYFHTHA